MLLRVLPWLGVFTLCTGANADSVTTASERTEALRQVAHGRLPTDSVEAVQYPQIEAIPTGPATHSTEEATSVEPDLIQVPGSFEDGVPGADLELFLPLGLRLGARLA